MDYNIIDVPKTIKAKLTAPIPSELIQQREGGGKKMLSYISGNTVIDMLNNAFGYTWSWEAHQEWITESIDHIDKYKKASPADWVITSQGPVAHVKGTLTVQLFDDITQRIVTVKKTGYGSKSVLGKQNDQESVFKAAGTDALKKAASLFGIGLELYRNEDEQNYFDEMNYEDPWTEEMKAQFAEERAYLINVMETYEMDDEVMNAQVYAFSEGMLTELGDITPDNIQTFCEWLKEQIAAQG